MSTEQKIGTKAKTDEQKPVRDHHVLDEAEAAAQKVAEDVKAAVQKVEEVRAQSAEAGDDILQFTAKAVQQSMEQFSDMLGVGQNGPKAQDAVQSSTRNFDSMIQCNMALANGSQEIARVWLDSTQERISHNLENVNRLYGCRTLADFSAVQSDIMRQSLEDVMQRNLRLSDTSVKITREAVARCSPSPH